MWFHYESKVLPFAGMDFFIELDVEARCPWSPVQGFSVDNVLVSVPCGCTEELETGAENICKDLGPCKGATAVCAGATGWQCAYTGDVELQPCTTDADCGGGYKCDTTKGVCPGIVIINEKLCDGKDGDCDGLPDDPWANPALPTAIGKECAPTKTCATDADCDPAAGSGHFLVKANDTRAIAGVTRDLRGRQIVSVKGHAQKLEVSRSFAGLFKGM